MTRYSKSERELIMEVLKPSMGAGAYIKDFRKSDAPQFKGKTEKERDKMAVAAYLDAKDEMDENVKTVAQNLNIDKKDVDKLKALMVMYTRAMKLPAGSPAQEKFTKEITKLRKELNMEDTVEWNGEELVETKLPPHLAKLFDKDGNFKDKKKQAMFDKMQKAARKGIKYTVKDVTPKGYGPSEETIKEFKNMIVTINDPRKRKKAIDDLVKKNFGIKKDVMNPSKFKVYGNDTDLNKYATDLKNFYGAKIKAEELEEAKKPSMQSLFNLIADTKNAQEGIAKIMKALKVDEKKASAIMDKLIAYALKKETIKEDGHEDVPSSIRMCKNIAEDAREIEQALASKGDENLDTWWTNKLAVASNSMNKLRDYITTPVQEEQMEETIKLDELKEPFVVIDTADGNKVVGMASDEKGAKSIITTSQLPPMKIKDKKTLKIVKVKKKQMIGQPIKEEVIEEGAMLNLATVKFQAKDALGKIRHKVAKKGNKYIISVDSNDEEDAQKAMKDHPLYAAGKLRVMPESFFKKITGVDKPILEGRKSSYDTDDDEEGANKHIIMQLRKAQNLRGMFNVEFENGEKKKVPGNIAIAALTKHGRFRTSIEKAAFEKKIRKSYRDLLNALKEK